MASARTAVAVAALATVGLTAGCRTTVVGQPPAAAVQPGAAGAASATAAVEGFLEAAKTTDVPRMAALFGNANGPVAQRAAQDDVERRMRALACYLTHDRAVVLSDVVGVGAGRAVTVELRQRELVRRPVFQVVQGPKGRWFVSSFDVNQLSDFCRAG